MNKYYKAIIKALTSSLGKRLSFFLSHGGIHFIVLLVLIVVAWVIYRTSLRQNEIVVKDIDITWQVNREIKNDYIGGSMKYDISYLYISIHPAKPQNGNYSQTLYATLHPVSECDSITCTVESYSSKKNFPFTIQPIFSDDAIQMKDNIICFTDWRKSNVANLCNLYSPKSPKVFFRINPRIVDLNGNIIKYPIFEDKYFRGDTTPYPPKIQIVMGSHSIYSVKDISSNGELKDPYIFNIVSPEPDASAQGRYIEYYGKEKLRKIFNDGILVVAEEISQTDAANKRMILFNVLIGTILAFCLEIIVQLVIKWRNLNCRN